MPDDSTASSAPNDTPRSDSPASRRRFLKLAGTVAASAAATAAGATMGCAPEGPPDRTASAMRGPERGSPVLDRRTLDALGEVVLPATLGATGRKEAVDGFVAWVDGYDPVAEEMHGYGYADIRYLPADPAPAWRSQLDALDLLARKTRRAAFADCDAAARLELVHVALSGVRTARLPDPLGAPHVAVALLSHWTATPEARDLAFGVLLGAGTCRSLDGVTEKPAPLTRPSA